MARIKYATGETPLNNKHQGYTFQKNHYGHSMYPCAKARKWRNYRQNRAMKFNQLCIRKWKELTTDQQTAWETFATTYPQTTNKSSTDYLSGYELFVKRNIFCLMNHGTADGWLLEPESTIDTEEEITFETLSSDMDIDVTEAYIDNFGLLPSVGDHLKLYAFLVGSVSGQIYTPLEIMLEVTQVYVDGLFITVNIPNSFELVDISLYLSKPCRSSQEYQGTKTRYMGCFTPKSFLKLTDTPETYSGEAGKTVIVNEFEDGLEFGEGGGGGLTCEDLADCSIIQSLQDQIDNIVEYLVEANDTSIPPVNFGLLYNAYCMFDSREILSSDDWQFLTYLEMRALWEYLGTSSNFGAHIKETGTTYWNSPNTGALNDAFMNVRGAGYRDLNGNFSSFMSNMRFWTTYTTTGSTYYAVGVSYNSAAFNLGLASQKTGYSLLFRKEASGVADYTKGIYVGNNGRVYRTICIDEYFYLADMFCETKFRDGSNIDEITINTEWAALTSAGMCAYDNDWDNV